MQNLSFASSPSKERISGLMQRSIQNIKELIEAET